MSSRNILSSAFIVLVAGCTVVQPDEPQAVELKEITISAYRADEQQPESKTQRDEQDGSLWWTPGDAISLFYGSGSAGGNRFVSTAAQASKVTNFTGNIGVITGGADVSLEDTYFWGLYPYNATASCDGSSVTTTLPNEQVATPGTFANNLFPSLGRSQGLAMGFYNICGGVRFTVTKEGLKKVTLRALGGEALTGRARIGFENGVPKVLEITDGSDEITLTTPDGEYLEVGRYYYFITFPQPLSQGIEMKFETSTEEGTYTRQTSNLTIKRSIFGTLNNVDQNVVYTQKTGIIPADWDVTMNVYTKAVDGVIKGFYPDCNGITRTTSAEETTKRLYNYVGYSKDNFHALFSTFVSNYVVHCPDNTSPTFPAFSAIDCVGGVVENTTNSEAAHVLKWTVTATDIWTAKYTYEYLVATNNLPATISTDSLYHYSHYKNPTSGNTIVVRLAAAFDDFNTNIPNANFVSGYWKEEATAPNGVSTEFNVAVPDATYPLNQDTLRANLHSMFVKYPSNNPTAPNQIFVDQSITDVNFYFDAVQIAKINKIGKYYATFKTNYSASAVKANPDLNMDCLELYLVKFGPDKDHAATVNVKIAEIYNEAPEATAPRWSQVWYGGNDPEDYGLEFGFGGEDGPSYADSLLNTGEMYTFFGAWGEVCDDAAKTIFISFGDEKARSFRGNFIRPINATTQSAVSFVDQLTYGYPGSYINVKDLLDLYDWRGHMFADEEGLWDYYGVDTIIVVTNGAKTDGGFNLAGTLPGDIQLVQRSAADFTAKYWDVQSNAYKNYPAYVAPYGYLTYRNQGPAINSDYHIWVPVKINYDWGWYETSDEEMIKITVKSAE